MHFTIVSNIADVWTRVAEDSPDPLCPDPIDEIASELQHVKDPGLLRKYALWLVERDIDRGLSVSFTLRLSIGSDRYLPVRPLECPMSSGVYESWLDG